ncbi:phage portal protein family protein [Flagellimonas eckloniae]|uniref:DUF935 family protein n=1 Tax=Flagellimonas eckloniae TaxID=346185 RepID=A0A0Q1DMH3_9FLAO|nr:DUF935 family protein [Allomuricauda eckloniae]KQC30188.1 hypothetical protein AAY42_10100 [Allomuricauda eckloniae]
MSFKEKLQDRILGWLPEDKIRVQMAKNDKSRKGGTKNRPTEIKRQPKAFQVKTLKDWKDAVALATDPENPNLLFLAELYENLLLDAHTHNTIETRIYRVLRSKFKLVNESGGENEELKVLFESPWFEQFLRHSLWSMYTGPKVIELFEVDELLELTKATLIPMEHTNPKKGFILKEPGDETGWPYKDGNLSRYYLQVGEDDELGLLNQLTPLILAKKLAMGSWLDYIEKYGIPGVWITTDNMTQERADELLEMGLQMISNHVGVIKGNETIALGELPKTDAHKTFQELISVINSEISKLILGQDGTTDQKDSTGTYGSLKVLAEVANDRHESDKLFVKVIVNKHLIPRLIEISSFYSGLSGHRLEWDESYDMPNSEYIDKVVSLTQAGYVIDHEAVSQKTGIPITGFSQNGAIASTKEEPPAK